MPIAGLITGVVAAAMSAPLSAFIFNGVTDNAGNNALVALFRSAGFSALAASFSQGLTVDPLDKAITFLIAYLIGMTAIPLVKSSARRLLLTNPDDTEYALRNTISGISTVRGVASYSVPKFWADDRTGTAASGKLIGVIHVAAARGADVEDVQERVTSYFAEHGIIITVQVEREGENTCWCGLGRAPVSSTPRNSVY